MEGCTTFQRKGFLFTPEEEAVRTKTVLCLLTQETLLTSGVYQVCDLCFYLTMGRGHILQQTTMHIIQTTIVSHMSFSVCFQSTLT